MGKIRSLVEFDGKVGNLVGSKGKDGSYTLRKYQPQVKDARSAKQMRYRVCWANMVHLWRAMSGEDRPSFEGKPTGWSDFNAFIHANRNRCLVALTKQEADLGVCIVGNYMLSNGSLPQINVDAVSGGKMVSNIALGDLTINAQTTISTFSKAVINNNAGWQEGDRIVGILLKQELVGYDQIPRVTAIISGITLQKENNEDLLEYVDEAVFAANDGYLGSKSSVNGGICWIRSKFDGNGGILVSPSVLTVNNTLLETYLSQNALDNAINSYGGIRYRGILDPGIVVASGGQINP